MENQFTSLNNLNGSLDFMQILDNVSDFVYYMSPDHKLLWVNKVVRDAYERGSEAMIGRFCFEVFHSEEKTCPSCPVGKVIESGMPQECDITSKDEMIFNHKGLPVKDNNGKIIGILIISHNITLQLTVETALEKAESAIETEDMAPVLNHWWVSKEWPNDFAPFRERFRLSEGLSVVFELLPVNDEGVDVWSLYPFE